VIEHYLHLFKYNLWATELSANSILAADKILPDAVKLLSHIVSSQQVWLDRIIGEQSGITPWDNFTVEECLVKSVDFTSEWINLLEGKRDNYLDKRIEYKYTKGERFENSIKDIITHLINHSTYHRAQIAQIVKRANGAPAITDYILYQRSFQK
jgi:uncharacterized damage-inducible protein DinB